MGRRAGSGACMHTQPQARLSQRERLLQQSHVGGAGGNSCFVICACHFTKAAGRGRPTESALNSLRVAASGPREHVRHGHLHIGHKPNRGPVRKMSKKVLSAEH